MPHQICEQFEYKPRVAGEFYSTWRQFIGAIVISILLTMTWGCSDKSYDTLQGQTMGTYYQVQFRAHSGCKPSQADIQSNLQRVNASMSTYQDDSELSLLNQNNTLEWISTSAELTTVLQAAQQVWVQSEGAFDVTVGPLVNLWGFGPAKFVHPPSAAAQLDAAARIGMQKLELRQSAVRKQQGDVYIDLSALAKGYAVDVVAAYLSTLGCTDYMVDIGGEMRLQGLSAKGKAWRIGIEMPDPQQIGMLHRVLSLTNVGLATSGDYRNYREVDGVRVDHVLDPRTGKPAQTQVVSATVIHTQAMLADAYATTLMVLSAPQALAWAESLGLAAYIISKPKGSNPRSVGQDSGESELQARYTSAMQSYLTDLDGS